MNRLTEESYVSESTAALGSLTHLRSAGVSLVLDSRGAAVPAIVHWGPDLGDLTADELIEMEFATHAAATDSRVDVPERVSVLPMPAEGWIGRPGIIGSRAGSAFSAAFTLVSEQVVPCSQTIATGRVFTLTDPVGLLDLVVEIELALSGLVRLRATLTNSDPTLEYTVDGVTVTVPVPAAADELFDLAGRHTRERVPQRSPFNVGTHLRESRQGKPGLDGALLLIAGTEGFDFTSGRGLGGPHGLVGQPAHVRRTHVQRPSSPGSRRTAARRGVAPRAR